MTRIVDKRNVCIVAVRNENEDGEIQFYRRGTLGGIVYGKFESKFEVKSGSMFDLPEHLTTPDMIAVLNTSIATGNANVVAKFNGVTVPATEVVVGGDTYKIWGFKPQDFVLFDFSGTATS